MRSYKRLTGRATKSPAFALFIWSAHTFTVNPARAVYLRKRAACFHRKNNASVKCEPHGIRIHRWMYTRTRIQEYKLENKKKYRSGYSKFVTVHLPMTGRVDLSKFLRAFTVRRVQYVERALVAVDGKQNAAAQWGGGGLVVFRKIIKLSLQYARTAL